MTWALPPCRDVHPPRHGARGGAMGEWMLQPCGAMEPWSHALASVTPRALTASFSCFWHATCVGPGRTRGQHATRVRMHATHVRMHATHVLPDRAEAGPALRMLELEDPSALFLSEKTSFDRSKKPRGSVGASASAPPRQLLLLLLGLLVSCCSFSFSSVVARLRQRQRESAPRHMRSTTRTTQEGA